MIEYKDYTPFYLRKMTKIEQIEFENQTKFLAAIEKVLAGEEVFRSYSKDNETKKKKIISKNRLYVGNNYSICINKAESGKIYLSIDYYSVENRIEYAKKKNEVQEIDIV